MDMQHSNFVTALERQFKEDFSYEMIPGNWTIFCFVAKIKVDIVKYSHHLIFPSQKLDGIRMYSTEDIIAMKLNAVLGRCTKKDLWDIYELLDHYSHSEMIGFHKRKYPSQMLLISIPQALLYFADPEQSEDPMSLKGQTWDTVKKESARK